jgi:hypothetical protein
MHNALQSEKNSFDHCLKKMNSQRSDHLSDRDTTLTSNAATNKHHRTPSFVWEGQKGFSKKVDKAKAIFNVTSLLDEL